MKLLKRLAVVCLLAMIVQACKKDYTPFTSENDISYNNANVESSFKINDPALPATEGFFMDNWQSRVFNLPATKEAETLKDNASVTVMVDPTQVVSRVPDYIYGNNAHAYMGPISTEPILLNHITNLAPHIIRVPGGSFSDMYFWNRTPAQKPADVPDKIVDPYGNPIPAGIYWYGRNTQSWTCTVDNYYEMMKKTGNTGMITVNYGYARYGTGPHPVQTAAHMAADWVRYDNGRTKYWEVGNECYGNWEAGYVIDVTKNKDGQPKFITGELYGKHFKIFADSMRKAAAEVGNTIKIGAVMTDRSVQMQSTEEAPNWNAGVLAVAGNTPDFYAVHSYYTPYGENTSANVILNSATSATHDVMEVIKNAAAKAGVVQKPVALTEWNIFAEGSKQMISNTSGLHSALVLGQLIKDQYGLACRWDLANNGWVNGNDMGMFNAKAANKPSDPKWNPRPAFYYMYYFQKFFGDRMVSSSVQGTADVVSYASTFTSGEVGVVLINKTNKDKVSSVAISNYTPGSKFYYYTLNGGRDNNEFSTKVLVNGIGPAGAEGGPLAYNTIPAISSPVQGNIKVNVPRLGAVFIVVSRK